MTRSFLALHTRHTWGVTTASCLEADHAAILDMMLVQYLTLMSDFDTEVQV